MPGYLLTVASTVQCTHQAPATVTPSNTRVLADGSPVVTSADMHTVAGCPFTVPGPKPQPCVTITWVAATRVFVGGTPSVVQVTGPGQGTCNSAEQIKQGPPVIGAIQPRVAGV